jgi:hypothetical protein
MIGNLRLGLALLVLGLLLKQSPAIFGQPLFFGRANSTSGVQLPPASLARRPLDKVAFGNGVFVAIGPGLALLSSKNGNHWSNHSSDICEIYANINFTTKTYSYGGDTITFAARLLSTNSPRSQSHSSERSGRGPGGPDEQINAEIIRLPRKLRGIAFGNNMFTAVGDNGIIMSSPDGEHWQKVSSGTSVSLASVVWGEAGFVVVGDKGVILISKDGATWERQISGTGKTLFSLAYGNQAYVAAGDDSTILVSRDGKLWTKANIGPELLQTIAFGNGVFVASSIYNGAFDGGQAMSSTDGKVWRKTQFPCPPRNQVASSENPWGMHSMNFCGGRFVAATTEGIYTSSDGSFWQPAREPNKFRLAFHGAAFGDGLFVAVGTGNGRGANPSESAHYLFSTVATSSDAIAWDMGTAKTPPSRLLFGGLVDAHTFVVHHSGGFPIFLKSEDQEHWMTRDKREISGSVFGNNILFSSGKEPRVLFSNDGVVWTPLSLLKADQPIISLPATHVEKNETGILDGIIISMNGNRYKLNLIANVGQPLEIEASTNLVDWTTIATLTNTNGLNFDDPEAGNYPMRFYRLRAP